MVLINSLTINYYDSPLFSSFFDAREKEAFYTSIKHIQQKREFHDTLLISLNRFMHYASSQSAIDSIQQCIYDHSAIKTPHTIIRDNIYHSSRICKSHLKGINLNGLRLLNMSQPPTFGYLKQQYLRAAKIHHPDFGGDHENMVSINKAYAKFHNLIYKHMNPHDLQDILASMVYINFIWVNPRLCRGTHRV
jgi:hypothetical protein